MGDIIGLGNVQCCILSQATLPGAGEMDGEVFPIHMTQSTQPHVYGHYVSCVSLACDALDLGE